MRKGLIQSFVVTTFCIMLAGCPDNSAQWSNTQLQLPAQRAYKTVWSAMTDHYQLHNFHHQVLVKKEVDWFLEHTAYIDELTDNARPYLYYVYRQTRKRQMPAEIALLPMIESNYNPFVFSKRGATGLWQMMPGTASGFGLKINWWYDGRRDIIASTDAALNYLTYLHHKFGDWMLAIAAYDAGEGTVKTAIAFNKQHGKPTDFWSIPLPYETKLYVPKLLALAKILSRPHHYHIKLPHTPNQPYFKRLPMHGQIDLIRIANYANTTPSTVRALNPGFRRWATVPHTPYILLLPKQQAETFLKNYQHKKQRHVVWMHHTVKPKESLYKLAKRYRTTVDIIANVNGLHNSTLQLKQNLLIPLAYHKKNLEKINRSFGNVAEDKLPGPQRLVHTVSRNDNLISIAKHYHVTPAQIRYWNNLAYRSSIKVNQQLVIWKKPKKLVSPFYTYHVRPGDNLILIAKRFGTHAANLKRVNQLNSNLLHIKQKLYIPKMTHQTHKAYLAKVDNQMVTHVVHVGETIGGIAKQYRVSVHSLMAWNNIKRSNLLKAGQALRIFLTKDTTKS